VRGRLIGVSAVAGIILSTGAALAASSGSIGIRLVAVPGVVPADSRARSYIIDRVAPGTSIERRIEISNTTASAAAVTVYPAAAGLYRGMFTFASGHSRNDLSRWTWLKQSLFHLAPGTKAFVPVTINVPSNASAGERYAVIWAEVSTRPPGAGGVRLVNRVGVRMYVSVGSGGTPPARFAIGRLIAKRSTSGRPLVVAKIRNSGGRTLAITGTLTLSKGPGGLRAGPIPLTLGMNLAPGRSEPATASLDKRLPRGPWRAQLRLRSGLFHRVVTATITFPRRAGAAKPVTARAASGGSRHLSLLVALVLGALLGIGGALGLFLRTPRARRLKPTATVGLPTIGGGTLANTNASVLIEKLG
jgi:hypothetical protein